MPMLRRWPPFFYLAVIAGLLIFGFWKGAQFVREFERATSPVKDISKYRDLLAKVREIGLARHFPDSPPLAAVGFNYTPHLLQGPLVFQLKCRIPENEINAIAHHFFCRSMSCVRC
jgi:hypothetical protein